MLHELDAPMQIVITWQCDQYLSLLRALAHQISRQDSVEHVEPANRLWKLVWARAELAPSHRHARVVGG